MLRFNRLVCENFMPYLREELSFPDGNGIVIVNGQNGHGKSSLLEALRFVLFGEIQSGKGANGLFNAINREGFANGNYTCKVTLDVDYLYLNYKIIRTYSPKKGKLNPKSSSDYDPPKVQVIHEDGHVLSESEQTKLLAKIMSKNVARFYLFDGELLDEYNRILSGEKTSETSSIKKSIEDILGLPILTNTRDHLKILLEEWDAMISKIGLENRDTQQITNIMVKEHQDMEYYEKEANSAKNKHEEYGVEIETINRSLDDVREDAANTDKKKILKTDVEDLEDQLGGEVADRAESLKKAWLFMLYSTMSEKQTDISAEHGKYTALQARIDERKSLIQKLKKSLDTGKCTLCNQILGNEAIKELQQKLQEHDFNEGLESSETEIQEKADALSKSLELINEYMKHYDPDLENSLNRLDTRITRCKQQIDTKKIELQQVERQLEASDLTQEELAGLRKSLDNAYSKRSEWERTYKENLANYEKAKEKWDTANKKLQEYGNKSAKLKNASEKQVKIRKIWVIFEKGVEEYRNTKRKRVEQAASDIYCQMSSLDYVGGLHITENYGVVPYNKSGEELPRPSSGYAHLEAFALIGGLHKNVPIKGPLFLDTPAGRLDKSNTRNLIQCIPQLSDQVILFIHDKEFDSGELYHHLSESILSEYTIEKISETESRIKKVER